MKKLIKYLLLLEIILILAFLLVIFMTRNRNDFSGLVAIYPEIATIVVGVVLLVLIFIQSVSKVTKTSSSNSSVSRLLSIIIILLGVPALGLYYASIGANRSGLALVCKLLFALGIVLTGLVMYRAFKPKSNSMST